MAWAGTNAVLLRGMTLDAMTLRNLCQAPSFHTLRQADFSYQSPASKNRIRGIGLLLPITSGRMVSFLCVSPSQAIREELTGADQVRATIQRR